MTKPPPRRARDRSSFHRWSPVAHVPQPKRYCPVHLGSALTPAEQRAVARALDAELLARLSAR